MKIIHCADLHLDLKMLSGLDAEKRKIKRNQLLENFINLVAYADKEKVDAVLLCGDIFDTQSPTKKTLNIFRNVVLNHKNIKFFHIYGNHDKNVLPFTNGETENFFTFMEDFSKIDLDDGVTIGGASLDRYVKDSFYSQINFEKDRFNILMLHQPINSADDYYSGIYTHNLSHHNIDYLALGHIHQNLQGKIDERGIWQYSGCLEGKSFNDNIPLGSKKGFYLLEYENGRFEKKFVPFSVYDYHILEVNVDLDDDHLKIQEKIDDLMKVLDKNSIVRVLLKGKRREDNPISVELLSGKYRKYFHFEIIDETKVLFDFEKYSLETFSLKGEFLRMVDNSELSDEEKEKISLIGIEVLKGEDISL